MVQDTHSDLQGLEYVAAETGGQTLTFTFDEVNELRNRLRQFLEAKNKELPPFVDRFAEGDLSQFDFLVGDRKTTKEGFLSLGNPTKDGRDQGIAEAKGIQLRDLTVATEFQIVEDGGDPLNWVGYKLGSFHVGVDGGFLIYLRNSGSITVPAVRDVW